jgi:hypothetical protein
MAARTTDDGPSLTNPSAPMPLARAAAAGAAAQRVHDAADRGLALGSSLPTIAAIHRQGSEVAAQRAWPVPRTGLRTRSSRRSARLVALAYDGANPISCRGARCPRKPGTVIRALGASPLASAA